MDKPAPSSIHGAEVVLTSPDLEGTIAFFTQRLAFRVDGVFPADDPREAALSGHGLRIRVRRGDPTVPVTLRVACEDPNAGDGPHLIAPDGTRIELVPSAPPITVPPLQSRLVVNHLRDATWNVGRAGMHYRDLIPGRLGGRFIASHIRIPEGGPVPDYVHYHRVRFQTITCVKGWVRLVYEDQGDPFVLEAGDSVLQPPQIRHRVLECSPGLEVVELGCPAEHETWADHTMDLPTPDHRPERVFGAQRFLRHRVAEERPVDWVAPGFTVVETGMTASTDGLLSLQVVRGDGGASTPALSHDRELLFYFLEAGSVRLTIDDQAHALEAGDAVVIPPATPRALEAASGLRLLRAQSPAG